MDEFAERRVGVGFVFEYHFSVYVVEYDVSCASCAIVVEVIIPVYAVFRQVILVYSLRYGSLLLVRQVESLLYDTASRTLVLGLEVLEILNAHLIVGQSEDKSEHEVWLAEREYTIVNGDVYALRQVLVSDGCMSV